MVRAGQEGRNPRRRHRVGGDVEHVGQRRDHGGDNAKRHQGDERVDRNGGPNRRLQLVAFPGRVVLRDVLDDGVPNPEIEQVKIPGELVQEHPDPVVHAAQAVDDERRH